MAGIDLERIVRAAMAQRIAEIVGEEADAAAKRVAERVRASTAEIAVSVFKDVNFETMQNQLVIKVINGGNHAENDRSR